MPAKVSRLHRPRDSSQIDSMSSMLPFADPNWQSDWYSPFHNESHFKLARYLRHFYEEEVFPYAEEWEEKGEVPHAIYQRVCQLGIVALHFAPDFPNLYDLLPAGFPIPCGLKPNELDAFHKMVALHELQRVGSAGVMGGVMFSGITMTLPCVLHFASPALKKRVANDILTGKERMAIAVTEPSTGSDVANLETTARLSDNGKYFVVNGSKKWITYGLSSEYFLTAVRTGGPGANGISILLIERKFGGVKTRKMNMQGGFATQTAFLDLEDVHVPVENLIGELGKGFQYTMANFNIERIEMLAGAITESRIAYEEALKYAHKRKTFGKLLIEHPVIRAKLGNMARQIEATQAWLDQIVYQQILFKDRKKFNDRVAAPVALLKAHATIVMEYVAREAAQIFGGLAYTRSGQGAVVERIYRDKNWYAIPGGSEEIMLDFGIRDGLKKGAAMGMKL